MWRGEYQPSSISLSDSQRLLPLPSPRNASDFIFRPGPRCLPIRCHSMSSSGLTSTEPAPVLVVMDPPLDRNRHGELARIRTEVPLTRGVRVSGRGRDRYRYLRAYRMFYKVL